MVTRAEIPALGTFVEELGADLVKRGEEAWRRSSDWESGIEKPTAAAGDDVCRCGHSVESHWQLEGTCTFVAVIHDSDDTEPRRYPCYCQGFVQAPSVTADDRAKEGKAIAATTAKHDEYRHALRLMADAAKGLRKIHDELCPPDPAEAEAKKNKRIGEWDPTTSLELIQAGWCPNCARAGVGAVPLAEPEGKQKLRRYADRCRPCGDFRKANDNIDKPREVVVAHHEGRRMKPEEITALVNRARQAQQQANGKGGKKKGKKHKAGRVAA